MKSFNESTEDSMGKKIVVGFVLLVLIAGGAFFFFEKTPQKNTSTPLPAPAPLSFTSFLGDWNDKVRAFDDLSEAYQLSSTDNKKMLQQLSEYIKNFVLPQNKEVAKELQSISQKYPGSIWAFYRNFLHTYAGKQQQYNSEWKDVSSSEQLRQIIQKATGNHDYDESIKLLLASHDPCAYFAIYKYELYKKGLSKNFRKCNAKIVDANKYPVLATLIRR